MVKKIKKKSKINKKYYIGIRIELPKRLLIKNLARIYNKCYNEESKIFEVCYDNSKVIANRIKDDMILTKSVLDVKSNNASFSILLNLNSDFKNAERIVKIINVLGDNKIIKEKVKNFIDKKSVLNLIPELEKIYEIFQNINKLMPRFIDCAWMNAPDAKLKLKK